jgi:NAD(P)-dependent dehydrogenase (short-subunit alcohol dehydrogenase family)
MSDLDFTGKGVLVTGASRGIGRACATMFAERGARVVVHCAGNLAAAEETRAALPGGPHAVEAADLADPAAVERLAAAAIERLGRIDVLVNNAGLWIEHRLADVDYDAWRAAWDRTIAVNLLGPANLSYLVARHMRERGGGRIVNVSSRGAFRGEPDGPAYGASKAGLNAMSQSLAKALGGDGVFVAVVAPGFVETDMAGPFLASEAGGAIRDESPLKRVARPEEVARTVLFLAAEGTEFLTGCVVDVNGASYLRT